VTLGHDPVEGNAEIFKADSDFREVGLKVVRMNIEVSPSADFRVRTIFAQCEAHVGMFAGKFIHAFPETIPPAIFVSIVRIPVSDFDGGYVTYMCSSAYFSAWSLL
jgi:hypothetical protein